MIFRLPMIDLWLKHVAKPAACLLQYKVLTANSVEELSTPAARSVLWCGWRYIINAPTVCDLRFSIFRSKFFAVQPPSAGLMSLGRLGILTFWASHPDMHAVGCCWNTLEHAAETTVRASQLSMLASLHYKGCCSCALPLVKLFKGLQHKLFRTLWHNTPLLLAPAGQPALKCSITAEDDTTWGMVRNAVTTAIATEAFFHAHWLSRSQAFRLTSGGLIGVTSVALLGCLYVLR